MSVDFFQIYYQKDHLKEMYPIAMPFYNHSVTEYFENDVIRTLVPISQADYISVCSWALRKKRQDGWTPMLCGIAGREDDLSEEKIFKEEFDVAVLTPRKPSHQMLLNASLWHREAWEPAINEMKKFMHIPSEVNTAIYENHFIARKEIYHAYVNTCLSPVMDFIRSNDIFLMDSGYAEKKQRIDPKALQDYIEKSGRQDYPIAPFILERLFSIWINDKQFKIINL